MQHRTAIALLAKRHGATITHNREHIHLILPNGARVVASGTPKNSTTALKNVERDLRRAVTR